jgi:pimeloyl-ACP methyl ester carboxylesterase
MHPNESLDQPGQQYVGLDREVARAERAFVDRELTSWTSRPLRWSGGATRVIEAGAGEPLLMVHGGMGNAADWAPLMARLAPTRRVLAVDRPGHGLATAFDYRGVDLSRHGVGFLSEIADALRLTSVDVVANSMGGNWAIALAAARPELVRHLVLVGAPAGSQRWFPAKERVLGWPLVGDLVAAMVRRGTPERTRSFWEGNIVAHPERLSRELLEFATLAARRNVGTWLSLIRNFATVGGVRSRYLVEPHLRRVRIPVSYVWGAQDAFDTPARGRQLAAAGSSPGHVVVVPDAGHLPWIDEPDVVAGAVAAALAGGDRDPAMRPTAERPSQAG